MASFCLLLLVSTHHMGISQAGYAALFMSMYSLFNDNNKTYEITHDQGVPIM